MEENIKQQARIFWSANVLGLLAFISINIYLPCLPLLAKDFHTTNTALKLSITLFLVGFSISQFFWGSLSVRYGRKKAVLLGLLITNIGTVCAMLSPNIQIFITSRVIEGVGVGAASVLCRALLTDALKLQKLSKALAYVSITGNIMPALAPIVGGYIAYLFNWRFIFGFLCIYTTLLFIVFYKYIEETNPSIQPNFKVSHALKEYFSAFKHRIFLGYLLPYAILSGGMLGYYAATPFIFIHYLHVPAQHYAFISLITVATYIVGAYSSTGLLNKYGADKAIFIGLSVALIAEIAAIIAVLIFHLSISTVIIPMAIYTFSAGLVAANATASALTALKHIAGAAAAVVGGSVYGASAALTAFITIMNLGKLSSLAIYMGVTVILSFFSFYFLVIKPKS